MKIMYIIRTHINTFINDENIVIFKKLYNAGENRESMKETLHDIYWRILWDLLFIISRETNAPLFTPVYDDYEEIEIGRDIDLTQVHLILTDMRGFDDYERITMLDFLKSLLEEYKLNQLSIEL